VLLNGWYKVQWASKKYEIKRKSNGNDEDYRRKIKSKEQLEEFYKKTYLKKVQEINSIQKETRLKILYYFNSENLEILGNDLNHADVLKSCDYDLENMQSHSSSHNNAYWDIYKASEWGNYDLNWIFFDERFELLDCIDETFLKLIKRIISEDIHPDNYKKNFRRYKRYHKTF